MTKEDHCKNIIETKQKIKIDDDKEVEMNFSDIKGVNLAHYVGCISDSTYPLYFGLSQENCDLDKDKRKELSTNKQKVCRKLRTGYWGI